MSQVQVLDLYILFICGTEYQLFVSVDKYFVIPASQSSSDVCNVSCVVCLWFYPVLTS